MKKIVNLKTLVELLKKHYLFLLLIPIIVIGQYFVLMPHLQYGLIDLDDGSIYGFKRHVNQAPNIVRFFIDSYIELGVYAHQYYYLGILNYFFGDNIIAYHWVTHIFKILSSITAYPFFYIISGSSLIAFVSAIIFAFSHSASGSLEAVVTGSDYPAILVLLIFLWIYFYIVKNNIFNFRWLLVALLFLLSALVFSTERVYSVIYLVLIVEAFNLLKFNSKDRLRDALKRAGVLLSPIFVASAIKPVFIGLLIPNSARLIQSLSSGRWDHILIPFIALTSVILPQKYWPYLLVGQTDKFLDFVRLLTTVTLPMLVIITLLFGKLLSKNTARFILVTFLMVVLGIIIIYFSALGHDWVNPGPALLGFYILGLSIAFFVEWITTRDRMYIGLFSGLFFSFLFIINTWFATMDQDLVFGGVHRYLTIASIFTSLFFGNLIILLHLKIYKKRLFSKILSFIPILLLIPVLYISVKETEDFFNNALKIGYGSYDKTYMRAQFWPYLTNLSVDNPRLFYIDHYTDVNNTYYYGNTVISGFDVWTLWLPNVNFNKELAPQFIADLDKLKSSVVEKDNKKGIFYKGVFYKPENFYAVLLKDRKVYDITSKVKKELNLNN